jgi:DNA-directed RNA polymerase specialized sigma24 family protein
VAEKQSLLQLMMRAQSDDPAAMTEILARFRPLIRTLSHSNAGNDQEDLEQELALLLVQIVANYNPPAWLSPNDTEARRNRHVRR